jgi:DNA modification methylase
MKNDTREENEQSASSSRTVNHILTGDALTMLKMLPDGIVQTCVSSPPYYGLRDYGVEGQIGLEESPEAFVEKLVQVFREVRRVLRDDGTCWINLGDSYAAGKAGRTDYGTEDPTSTLGPQRNGLPNNTRPGAVIPRKVPDGLKPKDLIGIPWMVAFALRADGWYLRSDIIWNKPTAMPESVTDRPTKAHEYLFLLAKSERYYYDADAIREPLRPKTFTTYGTKHHAQGNDALGKVKSDNWGRTVAERQPRVSADGSLAGANKRTVWTVCSQPYSEAHFATFPPKLIEPCILAGTSPRACEVCGSPWERVTAREPMIVRNGPKSGGYGSRTTDSLSGTMIEPARAVTTGWQPTCTCESEGTGKCIILDCFIGAGTTALVALQHNRNYLGIELNPSYVALAMKRIAHVQQNLWSTASFDEVAV